MIDIMTTCMIISLVLPLGMALKSEDNSILVDCQVIPICDIIKVELYIMISDNGECGGI